MQNNTRTFIVSRTTTVVLIREVEPGSCAFTRSREDAWSHARTLALPAKASQDPKRRLPAAIYFLGLDGEGSKLLQTAEATQAAWEVIQTGPNHDTALPVDGSPIASAPQPVEPARWIDIDASHRKAIDHLRAQVESGRGNEFAESVLGYYARNDRLTDGQRDAVLRGIEKYEAAKAAGPIPDVPAGRYALREGERVTFYVLDRPTDGKWAGYTFLKVQAGDDLHPVKGAARNTVLAKIKADPKAASVLYGRELGCCGVCGRTLTDEASRAAGIGPICAEKF